MKKTSISLIVIALLLLCQPGNLLAQESAKAGVKVSAELVSSYLWRGSPGYSVSGDGMTTFLAPNFQPTLAFTYGGLEIGTWASTDFTGTYKETDLYLSYSAGPFVFTVNDYYWDPAWLANRYFDMKNESTGHILEGMMMWKCKKWPVSLTVATMLYGADKKFDKDLGTFDPEKNNYSTYIELSYALKVNEEQKFDIFCGMTPTDGYYGDSYGNVDGFGVVNLGATGYKSLKLGENSELPLRASLIMNPMQEKAYIVFGITF